MELNNMEHSNRVVPQDCETDHFFQIRWFPALLTQKTGVKRAKKGEKSPNFKGGFLDLEPNGYRKKWTLGLGWFLKTAFSSKWFLGVEPHGWYKKRRFKQKVVPAMGNHL